eukprot:scaffold201908_cov17-Tisochrysis_lutea.AAC.1
MACDREIAATLLDCGPRYTFRLENKIQRNVATTTQPGVRLLHVIALPWSGKTGSFHPIHHHLAGASKQTHKPCGWPADEGTPSCRGDCFKQFLQHPSKLKTRQSAEGVAGGKICLWRQRSQILAKWSQTKALCFQVEHDVSGWSLVPITPNSFKGQRKNGVQSSTTSGCSQANAPALSAPGGNAYPVRAMGCRPTPCNTYMLPNAFPTLISHNQSATRSPTCSPFAGNNHSSSQQQAAVLPKEHTHSH